MASTKAALDYNMKVVLIILLLLFVNAGHLKAQSNPVITPAAGTFNFDGIPDEEFWRLLSPIKLITLTPIEGKEPTEKTTIKVTYDRNYIYLGAVMEYSNRTLLMSTTKKRDAFVGNTDYIAIILDDLNDRENTVGFLTTPSGSRTDVAVFNDGQGTQPYNITWNTFWDTKSVIKDSTWYVEIRIPVSSLRFQSKGDSAIMGMIIWRYTSNNNEFDIYPAIPYNWGGMTPYKASKAQRIVFHGIKNKKPLYVSPYIIGGIEQRKEKSHRTSNNSSTETELDAGLDLKYSLTNNMTLDVTINPDFAQVEADDQQINLTRFSLFFPEKRLFFQERASTFDFKSDGINTMFYSRKIGINNSRIVPIYAGARITGRISKWELGVLDMHTKKTSLSPSENMGVVRVKRQFGKSNSFLGGILTNRASDSSVNTVYGIDGAINYWKNDYVSFGLSQSFDKDSNNLFFHPDNSRIFLNFERRNNKGLGFDLTFARGGKDFNPSLGFEQRNNYHKIASVLKWVFTPSEKSPILNHKITVNGLIVKRNKFNNVQSRETGVDWTAYYKKNSYLGIALKSYTEDVEQEFAISQNLFVPKRKYNFLGAEATFTTSLVKSFHLSSYFYAGNFYDGNRYSISTLTTWNLSSALEISTSYEMNWIRFGNRNQSELLHRATLRSQLMFSTKTSFAAYLQYNKADGKFLGNIRFRYNPREGRDLFIVYNFGKTRYTLSEKRLLENILLIKYTHTLIL